MITAIIVYKSEDKSGNLGDGRFIGDFEHMPPSKKEIIEIEDTIREQNNLEICFITNIIPLAPEIEGGTEKDDIELHNDR